MRGNGKARMGKGRLEEISANDNPKKGDFSIPLTPTKEFKGKEVLM